MSNAALDALNQQLALARAGASGAVGNVVPFAGPAAQVSALPQGGKPVTLAEALAETGMKVDAYIKVEKAGFLIGKDTINYLQQVGPVEFKMSDIKPFYGVRYSNPPIYKRSYDRIIEARSKRSWADVVAQAQHADPKCTGDYQGVDIPFTTVADIVTADGKTVLLEAGKTLGWTSSITNWNPFAEFIKPFEEMRAAGQLPKDVKIRANLVWSQRKKDALIWGQLNFDGVTIADFDVD
jgi:hypothetical protein